MNLSLISERNSFPRRSNTRLERTRHERASLLSCVGEPLKRSVQRLAFIMDRLYLPIIYEGLSERDVAQHLRHSANLRNLVA